MAEIVKITARKNGPYKVEAPEGTVKVVDADGNEYDLKGKTVFAFCRCGASINKPFCDGTHSKIGFLAAEAAVKAEQAQSGAASGLPPEADSSRLKV